MTLPPVLLVIIGALLSAFGVAALAAGTGT